MSCNLPYRLISLIFIFLLIFIYNNLLDYYYAITINLPIKNAHTEKTYEI